MNHFQIRNTTNSSNNNNPYSNNSRSPPPRDPHRAFIGRASSNAHATSTNPMTGATNNLGN